MMTKTQPSGGSGRLAGFAGAGGAHREIRFEGKTLEELWPDLALLNEI